MKTVVKEVEVHIRDKHWVLVKREEVPVDTDVLLTIWAMCCKHNLLTNEIKGQKARLNINGRKQIYGVNYYESCVPVVM